MDFSTLIGVWGIIAAIAVLALATIIFNKKIQLGKNVQWVAGIISVLLLVTAVYQAGTFGDSGFGKVGIAPQAIGQLPPASSANVGTPAKTDVSKPTSLDTESSRMVGDRRCLVSSSSSGNQYQVALLNGKNASGPGFLAATVSAESDPQTTTLDTATTTAGNTLSYTTLNVAPCVDGNVFVLSSSGRGTAGTKATFNSFLTKASATIQTAGQENLNVIVYDRNGAVKSTFQANGSLDTGTSQAVSTAGTSNGNAYVQNATYSSGSSNTYYLDLQVNGTAGVYGTYGATDGVELSFDTVDSTKFSENALALSQVDDVSLSARKLSSQSQCPGTLVAKRGIESCWSAKTLDSGVTYRIKADIQSDRGDPGVTGSNPILYVDDKVYFRDTDNKIKYDFFDSSGADKGMAALVITFIVN